MTIPTMTKDPHRLLKERDAVDAVETVILHPTKFDILSSAGDAYAVHHTGNRMFQAFIKANLHRFGGGGRREDLSLINDVFRAIKNSGGRFLIRVENRRIEEGSGLGRWRVLSDGHSKYKILCTFESFKDIQLHWTPSRKRSRRGRSSSF
jgi:hypothetical protein